MLPDQITDAIEKTLARTKSPVLGARWSYYSGNHPKIWVTPKLKETFRNLADSLFENYCGMAVDSRLARLEITGWEGEGAEAATLKWAESGFPQRQDVFYRWGLVHGSAYLVVQDDVITANAADLIYAEPDADDWMNVAWAGKAWVDAGYWRITLWDETTLYRYTGPEAKVTKNNKTTVPKADAFTYESEERHGYDRVPVFPTDPYGYATAPMLDQISPVQDRINKIVANKFVAAEFSAFKQRVFFTRQQVDPYTVRQQPDHAIVLDPGDSDGKASVQELTATDLANYDNAKTAEVDALFTIAALPRHMRVNPGATPSGEAIKADEGPFVESLRSHQREFGGAIVAALALVGVTAEPIWRDVETHDDLINAQIVDTLVNAGIPWQIAAMRYLGMTQEDVDKATELTGTSNGLIAQQTTAMLSNPTLTL